MPTQYGCPIVTGEEAAIPARERAAATRKDFMVKAVFVV